jgi:hypothetical protein
MLVVAERIDVSRKTIRAALEVGFVYFSAHVSPMVISNG